MKAGTTSLRSLLKQALSFALAFAIWFAPIPAGLTKEAWHLFAIFAAAIFAVILNSFPLLTASLLAVSAAVLTRTVDPGKAFAGFANASVLLVVVAFLVANAVVKSGLGRRISLLVVSVFGRSTLGLGYSIFLTDAMIALLPLILYKLFPPGVTKTPDAPKAARDALRTMGPLTRNEWVVAAAFAFMVTGWVMAGTLNLSLAAVAFAGLGALLATNVLSLDDINLQGGTLVTFIWLAVLFALSGQLNELGFMGYVGERLTSLLGGITWPIAYVVLLVLYVLMHYMFVSQTAQILALFDVFLGVGVKTGVPAHLMAFALLFASSYFSTITPQGGSQNVIFVGSDYLTQGELYRLGLLTTVFCLLVFLVIGTPWLLFVAR